MLPKYTREGRDIAVSGIKQLIRDVRRATKDPGPPPALTTSSSPRETGTTQLPQPASNVGDSPRDATEIADDRETELDGTPGRPHPRAPTPLHLQDKKEPLPLLPRGASPSSQEGCRVRRPPRRCLSLQPFPRQLKSRTPFSPQRLPRPAKTVAASGPLPLRPLSRKPSRTTACGSCSRKWVHGGARWARGRRGPPRSRTASTSPLWGTRRPGRVPRPGGEVPSSTWAPRGLAMAWCVLTARASGLTSVRTSRSTRPGANRGEQMGAPSTSTTHLP